jgi:hypothetical protein
MCKDDMVKEAFEEKLTAHKIVFQIAEDTQTYQEIKIIGTTFNDTYIYILDGILYIRNKASNFWTNISYLGDDLEKQL